MRRSAAGADHLIDSETDDKLDQIIKAQLGVGERQ